MAWRSAAITYAPGIRVLHRFSQISLLVGLIPAKSRRFVIVLVVVLETMRSALSCSIMQTYGTIHVRVPFRGIEEKLDAAAGLLPLITDHGFHYVALRLFVPG